MVEAAALSGTERPSNSLLLGPEGVECLLIERLADVRRESVAELDEERLLDVERRAAVTLTAGAIDSHGVRVVRDDPEQIDAVGAGGQLGGAAEEREDLVTPRYSVATAFVPGTRPKPVRTIAAFGCSLRTDPAS